MIVLKAEVFNDGRDTGENIATKLETMLSSWGIPKENVLCIVRDGGTNMKKDSGCTSVVRIVTRNSLFDKMKNEYLRNLEEKLCFLRDHLFTQDNFTESTFEIPVTTTNRQGRPRKSFGESSERSKRRKTEEIRSNVEDGVIVHAVQVELRKSGKSDSRVLQDITSSPTRATKYKRAFDTSNLIQEAKKKCYPPPETSTVTSTCAETQLQPLIDITVKRLSEFLEVLLTIKEQERKTLKLICKWGCDGSQQAQYKQKLDNEDDSDANIFHSCFVPVRLTCGTDNQKVLWENPTPSSARFCRPIRFRFVKERTDITNEEINYVKNSIDNLVATKVDIEGE
ncbi:hypothetical protein EVAR_52330_1 [Eumeta japonica]|uniref:Uncharacterized protein n=1 Tax=Eumeta variegata TaxID=151549 RepID=A0A4C1Y256_EUMVA|nr:hypothetical protein EVAR_52330_1 [Eumeta japonica]